MEWFDFKGFTHFTAFVVIMLVTFLLGWIFRRLYNRFIRNSTTIIKNDPTNYKFVGHVISAMIYIIGFSLAVIAVPSLKTVSQSLLAGAGILAVAVGFASQAALSNVISGFFLIVFKPYRVNDRLNVQGTLNGVVEDITLRHTVIRDFENKRIIIPNSLISNEIIVNSDITDERICRFIDISISYDSDLLKAKDIIHEEIFNHPSHIDHRTPEQIEAGDEEVVVRVILLGDSGITIRGWAWAEASVTAFPMACDLIESIKLRFDEEDIEIPYPHRTVVQKIKK